MQFADPSVHDLDPFAQTFVQIAQFISLKLEFDFCMFPPFVMFAFMLIICEGNIGILQMPF